jgi:hypothetical protein
MSLLIIAGFLLFNASIVAAVKMRTDEPVHRKGYRNLFIEAG